MQARFKVVTHVKTFVRPERSVGQRIVKGVKQKSQVAELRNICRKSTANKHEVQSTETLIHTFSTIRG
jgi:hypothetical protein